VGRAEALDILGDCLGLHFGTQHLTRARLKLYAAPGLWTSLIDLALTTGLLPAVESAVARCGLLPVAGVQSGAAGLGGALARVRSDHRARRERMRARLTEIADDLTRAGIQALLIKGAADLWTGTPGWRSMRDLDIVVPPHQAATAQRLLVSAGYRPAPDGERRPHHLEAMVRDDLPGWIELHVSASNRRGERMLPTSVMLHHATGGSWSQSSIRLPHPAVHVLHGLVHHHFSNRGAAYGVIALKGLFEFAHGYAALDEVGVRLLRRLASRHSRLSAAVDLWTAAAAGLFRMADHARFRAMPDASRRWAAIAERMQGDTPCSFVDAVREDLGMSLSRPRLRAAVAAGGHATQLAVTWHSLRTVFGETPSTPRGRAQARQRASGFIVPAM
jgi:hypothetical protein